MIELHSSFPIREDAFVNSDEFRRSIENTKNRTVSLRGTGLAKWLPFPVGAALEKLGFGDSASSVEDVRILSQMSAEDMIARLTKIGSVLCEHPGFEESAVMKQGLDAISEQIEMIDHLELLRRTPMEASL